MAAEHEVLKRLRERLARVGNRCSPAEEESRRPPRIVIDEFLSNAIGQGGLLVEWMSDGGTGDSSVAFLTARDWQQWWNWVVVIDPVGEFYPPAADTMGLRAEKLVVVQPRSQRETLWAWEQSLRAKSTTVIGPLARAPAQALRRLKLAVENGGGLALVLRPLQLRHEPSWADLRLVATPVPSSGSTKSFSRRVRVESVYVRGGLAGKSMIVGISDETSSLSLASELAGPTTESRTA